MLKQSIETSFVGREADLLLINKLWEKQQASLLILYGRRRVGKTRLLTHWRAQHADQALYWVAEPMTPRDQLRSFSHALYNFSKPHSPVPAGITYSNWEQAFWHAAELAKDQRIALLIDEFTYLIDADETIVGMLQKAWDQWLKNSNLMLVLSGSQMGLMQRHLLTYDAPLYGRATALLKLPPLPFGVMHEYFPMYSAEDRVAIYSVFGGVPAYWERIDPEQPVMQNIRDLLLSSTNAFMHDEPLWLLQDFVTEPYNYVGIMQAISRDDRTTSRICNRTGLSKGLVSRYLSILRDTGFVERRVPVTEDERSRRSRYYVTDPYLRFYYHFLSANRTQLAIGAQRQALDMIVEGLPPFIRDNTWLELCHEWVKRMSGNGDLPFYMNEVGSAWSGNTTIDVVGLNKQRNEIILGTCHWQEDPAGVGDLQELLTKASAIVPEKGKWTVGLLGFASSGWTDEARSFAEGTVNLGYSDRNWRPVWSQLLDLPTVEADLSRLVKMVG